MCFYGQCLNLTNYHNQHRKSYWIGACVNLSVFLLYGEIAIKNRIGKLPLPMGVHGIFSRIDALGYGIVGIDQQHIEAYNTLPLLNRDPFDGIIVATALAEGMIIVTADENIQKFDVLWVW